MGTRLPVASFSWSSITSERNTNILPAAQLRARHARVGPRLEGMLERCYDLGVKNLLECEALEPVEAHDDAYPLVRIAGHANGGNTPVPVRGFQAYLRPGSKVSRTTNGLFRLPPPRSRRRHAPSGTRSSWECGELSKRLRKRAIEVPYALTTRRLRHLCIKDACRTSRSRLQRERSHTHRRSRGFGRRPRSHPAAWEPQ